MILLSNNSVPKRVGMLAAKKGVRKGQHFTLGLTGTSFVETAERQTQQEKTHGAGCRCCKEVRKNLNTRSTHRKQGLHDGHLFVAAKTAMLVMPPTLPTAQAENRERFPVHCRHDRFQPEVPPASKFHAGAHFH